MAERQVERQRGPIGGIGHACGIEPIEGLSNPFNDECATVENRRFRSAGLLLIRAAEAMLALRAGIAMNQRQLAQIHRIPPFQIIVANAHQQRCAPQIGHVIGRGKLQIVDECPVVAVCRKRRRGCRSCRIQAHSSKRVGRDLFVAPSGHNGGNCVCVRRLGPRHEPPHEDGAGHDCGEHSALEESSSCHPVLLAAREATSRVLESTRKLAPLNWRSIQDG